MKKLIFAVLSLMMVGCTNPSMEEGLESLQEKLAAVEAEMAQVDIDQMTSDLEAMNAQATQALADAEETNQALADAVVKLQELREQLAAVQAILDEAATVEQVKALRDKVAEISEGISMLVFVADYDYDGVMNGLDQCPDTPITEINDVNGVGCSPSQLAG